MRTLKLVLEYDGTNYVGWQRQIEGTSIQGLVENALVPFEGAAVTVHGAGRTDAGVHALAQVASVTLTALHDAAAVHRGLNASLPDDVRVVSVEEVSSTFHARFSAVSKTYEYRIVNAPFVSAFLHRYVWQVPGRLDVESMVAAAHVLQGRHDFASFQGMGSTTNTTIRTIHRIDWQRGGAYDRPLVMRIEGDGFLRHMVRNIIGTLVEVGVAKRPVSSVGDILERRDRSQAGRTAPPSGLFLANVKY